MIGSTVLLAMFLAAQASGISGTWIATRETPMGEMEIVYELKLSNGKITGMQKLPFGDSPIVDGKLEGDRVELTVEVESFGNLEKRTIKGRLVNDTLEITPAMPAPPPGFGPGGPGARANPSLSPNGPGAGTRAMTGP